MEGEEADREADLVQGGTGWWGGWVGVGHEPMQLLVNWKAQLTRMACQFK